VVQRPYGSSVAGTESTRILGRVGRMGRVGIFVLVKHSARYFRGRAAGIRLTASH
jgi:hypothetical protein